MYDRRHSKRDDSVAMVADTVNPIRVELDYAPEIRLGASAWVRPEIF